MNTSIYTLPEIYDIAFSFRDYTKAVDFLIEAAALAGLSDISSMAELGCGPAQYCREFSRRGITAFGVDYTDEMVTYAQKLTSDERRTCEIIKADIRSFRLPQRVELAVCMMATFHCLLSNKDIVSHLNSVADNLKENGLYIIEMNHPRQIFNQSPSAQNTWEVEQEGIKVRTDWASDATVDPLTEIGEGTVTFTVEKDNKTEEFTCTEQWHEISLGLMRALLELSGRFHIAAMYGDLDTAVPFDNDKKAWRMILVLRKFA